jgi:Cof subfamily protein (haloacid dehalogenase superfamily)
MPKMIAMDLDGTLLTNDKNVSKYNISILQICKTYGIKIVTATARSEKSSKRINDLVKPDYMILNGGALVMDFNRKILYERLMSCKTTDGIIAECVNNENVGNITVETMEDYYTTFKETIDFIDYVDYMHGKYNDFTKPLMQKSYKITCEILNLKIGKEIVQKYEESSFIMFSGEGWGRFAHKEAEKISAVKEVVKKEKITLNDVVAFGDDYNDIDMVKECGTGIAMGNGIKEIKEAAKYICKTNNEDGVGKWLEENILVK